MHLTKKTTILFPPALHDHLARVARQRRTSLGELVRRACEREYGHSSVESRLAAVQELTAMELPVGDPDELERESVPSADDLLP